MKIAIIGLGFVGNSLLNGLKKSVEVAKIDPTLGTNITSLINFNPDAVFICVPTPMSDDNSQDISIIRQVISEIKSCNLDALVVLKSTVLPNYVKEIEDSIPNFVYNPEFLREKHADEDFINADLIVFGGSKESSETLANIYKNYTHCICSDYVFTDPITASIIKYTINSFLSIKVTYFNELQKLFIESGANETWDHFTSSLSKDKRIGESHMQVPGPDGRYGFGGACLPKDSNAFYHYSKKINSDLSLLNSAINLNNSIRSQYNDLIERELDQNINFNGENN